MPAKRLQQYLDQQGGKYRVITHSPAFTAQVVAEVAHIPGSVLAKVVPAPNKKAEHLLGFF